MDTVGRMPMCNRKMAMQDENRGQSVGWEQLRNENGEDRSRLEYLHHSVYDERLRNGVLWAGMIGVL